MLQVARNLTMAGWGFLAGMRYAKMDRDSKFTAAFRNVVMVAGVKPVVLPPHCPLMNAFAERWVRTAKEECLSKLILFGEVSLRRAISSFEGHDHEERNNQGKENSRWSPIASGRRTATFDAESASAECSSSTSEPLHEFLGGTGDPTDSVPMTMTRSCARLPGSGKYRNREKHPSRIRPQAWIPDAN